MTSGPEPIDVGGGAIAYFAYGSNMCARQMAMRCEGARRPRLAWLSGHSVLINERGVATLRAEPLGEVYGVVWTIAPDDLGALDRYEGTDEGRYDRSRITVQTAAGPELAEVYVDHRMAPGVPRPGYLERIIAAAVAHGVPAEHVAHLRAQAAAPAPAA